MNIERERAAFEWWASDEGESPLAKERVGGGYKLAQIQSYWMAWQARADLDSEQQPDVAQLVEALAELCDEIDKHEIHAAISKTSISWFKLKARKALADYRKGERQA